MIIACTSYVVCKIIVFMSYTSCVLESFSCLFGSLLHYSIGVVLADKNTCFEEEFSAATYEGLPEVLGN